MPKTILEQLFSSGARERILKLLLRHKDDYFELKEIVRKVKSGKLAVRKEMKNLEKIGLVQLRLGKHPLTKRKQNLFFVKPDFYFFKELSALVLKPSPLSRKNLLKRISGIGNVKLAVLSGIFINQENARADLLLVAGKIKQRNLTSLLSNLEVDLGKEINYVLLSEEEFKYRLNMFDKFLRDLLEGPHEILIEKIHPHT